MLVTDDDEVQHTLVRELLAPLGFDVVTACGGQECLSLVERCKPSLIVLDVAMPEMDGWDVAARLRRVMRERTAI